MMKGIEMFIFRILFVMLSLGILTSTQAQMQSEPYSRDKITAEAFKIVLTALDLNEKTLNIRYEIRNDSEHDIWILAGTGDSSVDASPLLDDDRTFIIWQKLDVPRLVFSEMFYGRYVRLPAGKIQTESVSLTFPVHLHYNHEVGQKAQDFDYATRLVIEIGYYVGDLPGMIRSILEKAEKNDDGSINDSLRDIKDCFGGLLYFNKQNERLRQRDEEILIPYTGQALKGEQVMRISIDGLLIPFKKKIDLSLERHPPDLTPYERIEIRYQPSMLEYLFPYEGQQNLLSLAETDYLNSEKTLVLDDKKDLRAFAHEVSEGIYASGIIRQRSVAHVVCYNNGERLMSFPIYNDSSIVTEGMYRFFYFEGFPSLRRLTPKIQLIELRIQCAANLKDLWSWLRLYNKIGKFENKYPPPTGWCDAVVRAYESVGRLKEDAKMPFKCPSASIGRCHYAMNPNCKYDSPQDMILLFETKAGWNQHGGPELFTFDSHDPKGGCVLLNDGTVKFNRTTEELQQLRWK